MERVNDNSKGGINFRENRWWSFRFHVPLPLSSARILFSGRRPSGLKRNKGEREKGREEIRKEALEVGRSRAARRFPG